MINKRGIVILSSAILLSLLSIPLIYAETTLFPYIEIGTGYNDNISFVSANARKSTLVTHTIGATIFQPLNSQLSATVSGFADGRYFTDTDINSSLYQFMSASLRVIPHTKLEIEIPVSFLRYTPSDRNRKLNQYSIQPTAYYQLIEGHWIKTYFSREKYRYYSSEYNNTSKDTVYVGYVYTNKPFMLNPYISYQSISETYNEKRVGLEWGVHMWRRHQITVSGAVSRRRYDNNDAEYEYDMGVYYSVAMTPELSLNINANYFYLDDQTGENDSKNWTTGVSISWATKWTVFEARPDDNQDKINTQFQQARQWYDQQQYQKAIRVLQTIISKNPDHLESYYVMAYAYIKQGKFQSALPYLIFVYENTQDPQIESVIARLRETF